MRRSVAECFSHSCRWWLALAGTLAALSQTGALAAYPDRPIRIVVPNPPGSNSDILVRQIAPKLTEHLGQSIIVDNRPGGEEMIGPAMVAHAAPDGYTLVFGTSTDMAANVWLFKKMSYDPVKDFAAIGLLGRNPDALVVKNSLPVKTLADLVAYIKARPGKLNYSTAQGGPLFAAAWFAKLANLDIQRVLYPSGPNSLMDVLAGTMVFSLTPYGPVAGMVQSGQMRVLAVTSEQRVPWLPNVPTMVESGYPGLVFLSWVGFYAPKQTPRDIIHKLADAVNASLQDPQIQKSYQAAGSLITQMSPEDTDKFTISEVEQMRKLVVISGATVQ